MNIDLSSLINLLDSLESAKIYYTLRHTQENAISVDVTVPGERWEIDYYNDGSIEIEIFKSNGLIHDRNKLNELFTKFSD